MIVIAAFALNLAHPGPVFGRAEDINEVLSVPVEK